MTATAPASPPKRLSLKRRIRNTAAARALERKVQDFERWLGRLSPAGGGEIIDGAHFPWVERLEANWPAIRRELDAVLAGPAAVPNIQDLSPTQRGLTRGHGYWKSFIFHGYGYWAEENCRRCPETTKLLREIPGLTLAFFSILSPGKHIPAHRGAYKGLVRAHLGLIVPEPSTGTRMRVGESVVHWKEGECVLFDDTFNHEVWNETDGLRAVLIIDVPRPWPGPLAAVNRALLSLFRFSPDGADFVRRVRASEQAGTSAAL
jgi:beta-hydroxylase